MWHSKYIFCEVCIVYLWHFRCFLWHFRFIYAHSLSQSSCKHRGYQERLGGRDQRCHWKGKEKRPQRSFSRGAKDCCRVTWRCRTCLVSWWSCWNLSGKRTESVSLMKSLIIAIFRQKYVPPGLTYWLGGITVVVVGHSFAGYLKLLGVRLITKTYNEKRQKEQGTGTQFLNQIPDFPKFLLGWLCTIGIQEYGSWEGVLCLFRTTEEK